MLQQYEQFPRLHSEAKLINAKFHALQNKTILKHLESDTVPLL